MRRLKNLALTVSRKNNVKVIFKGGTMPIISLEHALKKNNLLYAINNRTEFQFNRLRTYDFQLKLFDTAVTLKTVKVIKNYMSG